MTEQAFIGISFAATDRAVIALACSDGAALVSLDGLSSFDLINFTLAASARNVTAKRKPVLVSFDFATDLELLVKDWTKADRDQLFGLTARAEKKANYETPELAMPPSREVTYRNVKIELLPGKTLRLKQENKGRVVLSDLQSYFAPCDLEAAVLEYLSETIPRVEKNLLPLWTAELAKEIAARSVARAQLTVRLAERIQTATQGADLNPRSWYGPSAIAAHCLNKWGARKQAKRLNEMNSPNELVKAIDCAYFGGRVEVLKLGTIQDVRTFDLNSAYAYATTLLAQFYAPLRFTRKHDPGAPFACWLVDYDLPATVTLGPVPHRIASRTQYGRRGRGYYWQPEVDYLLQRWPDHVRVLWGYTTPSYVPVAFAGDIQKLYDYRALLKENGDAAQKIIKLALSNIYGKFAQNEGAAYYQCRAWAGWITSLVRRLLLEAVTGIENKVIAFAQDAVHLRGTDCNVPIGCGLGEWKRQAYESGIYVAPGLHDLRATQSKTATRGSNLALNFDRLAGDLSEGRSAEIGRSFFVGWQLARSAPLKYEQFYLDEMVETLTIAPGRSRARRYLTNFDWSKEYRDSLISKEWTGQLSGRYLPQENCSLSLRLRMKDQGWA